MFFGILCGFAIGFCVASIAMDASDKAKTRIAIFYTTIVVLTVIGAAIGNTFANYQIKENLYGFNAAKDTYETAIQDSSMSGFEKMQIVNTAIEKNEAISKEKATIDAWWNIGIDKSLKNQLRNMQLITLN